MRTGLPERMVIAMKARELGRKGIVVGDDVDLVGDTRATPTRLARIVRLTPRRSVLRRTADDTDPVERVIVANADQLVIVSALANPEPRPRLIDRCLVAAYDAGLDPLLVLTKADLADAGRLPRQLRTAQRAARRHRDRRQSGFDGLEALHEQLVDRVSVFVGHSGVGKSTLVNGLVPDARRAVGVVNDFTGRGRHTSTLRGRAAPARTASGWVIDTPGVRSFGLAHVDLARIISALPRPRARHRRSARAGAPTTRRSAPSTPGSPPVRPARPAPRRLESLRRLLRARSGESRLTRAAARAAGPEHEVAADGEREATAAASRPGARPARAAAPTGRSSRRSARPTTRTTAGPRRRAHRARAGPRAGATAAAPPRKPGRQRQPLPGEQQQPRQRRPRAAAPVAARDRPAPPTTPPPRRRARPPGRRWPACPPS